MSNETATPGSDRSPDIPTRVGWIGTGVMGSSMCGRLLEAGHELTVYTRSMDRALPLIDSGATWVDTPAAVAEAADIVFVMVGYPDDVREVILGPDGVLSTAQAGTIVVDMTTSDPQLAVEIGSTAEAKDVQALDAPVSGGDVGAKNGTLSIMVGGPSETFEQVLPLLELMGATIVLQGGHGAGQYTKLVNQTLIAGTMIAMAEALVFAQGMGLDAGRVLESVSGGAAGSWSLSNLAPRALDGNFDPGFFLDHFVKDMGLALEASSREQLAMPGLALAHQLYVAAQGQGLGRSGTHAIVETVAGLSNRDWTTSAS